MRLHRLILIPGLLAALLVGCSEEEEYPARSTPDGGTQQAQTPSPDGGVQTQEPPPAGDPTPPAPPAPPPDPVPPYGY
jgi:hypothetical protein